MTSSFLQRNLKACLFSTNILVATVALINIAGGTLLALDPEGGSQEHGLKTHLPDRRTNTFLPDSSGVLSGDGAWKNFPFVLIAIGGFSIGLSIIGLFAVHKESVYVLSTYCLFVLISIFFQMAAIFVIKLNNANINPSLIPFFLISSILSCLILLSIVICLFLVICYAKGFKTIVNV